MKINQVIFIPVFLLLVTSCNENKEDNNKEQPQRNVPTVLVANPQTHEFKSDLQISGTVKADKSIKLFAMSNGYLQQLKADIGDFVSEGQLLALLENPELFRDKEKLEAELKGKKSIHERLKNIYEKTPQLTTVAEVEIAEAEYESAKAQLNSLLLQISYFNVKAPFSGVITNRYADKGALIQNGLNMSNASPLFEIQSLNPVRVVVDVPETDAVLINKNTETLVSFPELPDGKFPAKISRIAYGLDETTKTMRVEIDIPNADLKIRPGMYAKAQIQRGGHKDVLSVPNEAIGNMKGQSFLYVVSNEIVKKVEIKTGIRDEKFTEILSGEISSADKVVVQGKEFCYDGAIVKVKEQQIKNNP